VNGPRERILGRVRDAVRVPAARPPLPTEAPVFPPVPDPEQYFARIFSALKGEVIASPQALRDFVGGFGKVATDGSPLVRDAAGPGNAADARDADLGITGCDCLIAQLGAIVVSTQSAGGRALSVLPPTHLVIARRDQLLPDLASALTFIRRRYEGRWPSTLSILAGPSRTGDIEKIIVMGAHGPKRLALYWVD
jgi:L-lactate dehydrogenase complex protein LldG